MVAVGVVANFARQAMATVVHEATREQTYLAACFARMVHPREEFSGGVQAVQHIVERPPWHQFLVFVTIPGDHYTDNHSPHHS